MSLTHNQLILVLPPCPPSRIADPGKVFFPRYPIFPQYITGYLECFRELFQHMFGNIKFFEKEKSFGCGKKSFSSDTDTEIGHCFGFLLQKPGFSYNSLKGFLSMASR